MQLADGSIVPMDEPCRQLLLLKLLEMSSKGLRCLGLAFKDDLGELSDYYAECHPAHKKLLDPSNYSLIETNLIFVGVVGLRVCSYHEALLGCTKTAICELLECYGRTDGYIYSITSLGQKLNETFIIEINFLSSYP